MPSGLNATPVTLPVCPLSVSSSWPVAASQSLTVWSPLAEARRLPSGLNATPVTLPVCPLSVSSSWPVAASQSLTVWSSLAEASRLPSGLNDTLIDAAGVPLEREQFLARGGVPELDRLVPARGGESLAVGAERHARDAVGVPLEREKLRVVEPLQVVPFEPAELGLIGILQKLPCMSHIGIIPLALSQVDVCEIGILASLPQSILQAGVGLEITFRCRSASSRAAIRLTLALPISFRRRSASSRAAFRPILALLSSLEPRSPPARSTPPCAIARKRPRDPGVRSGERPRSRPRWPACGGPICGRVPSGETGRAVIGSPRSQRSRSSASSAAVG